MQTLYKTVGFFTLLFVLSATAFSSEANAKHHKGKHGKKHHKSTHGSKKAGEKAGDKETTTPVDGQ